MKTSAKINLAKAVLSEIKTEANKTARLLGFNAATEIVAGDRLAVIESTNFGYRKYSNDKYVSNAYRNHFGWKNTYYQSVECVVSIPATLVQKTQKWEAFLIACPDFTERRFSIFGDLLD